jgi:CheY-like chemotaxis protein
VTGDGDSAKAVVLLVEDEEESRDALQELLELEGYSIHAVSNGREALEAIATLGDRLCLVLLDLFMPVMDGWQVIDALRADGRLAKLRVVIVTSAAHRAPAGIPVLEKPLDLARVMQTLETYC